MGAVNGKRQGPAPTLTGERRNGHVPFRVHDRPLWLSYSHFCRLVRLVIARGLTESGFVADPDVLYPEAVCRLRLGIDEAAGPGTGAILIETGFGREYRLGIPVSEAALGPEFAELAGRGVLTVEEVAMLRELCQTERRAARRPAWNRKVTGT
jgi:hypothetical protein